MTTDASIMVGTTIVQNPGSSFSMESLLILAFCTVSWLELFGGMQGLLGVRKKTSSMATHTKGEIMANLSNVGRVASCWLLVVCCWCLLVGLSLAELIMESSKHGAGSFQGLLFH